MKDYRTSLWSQTPLSCLIAFSSLLSPKMKTFPYSYCILCSAIAESVVGIFFSMPEVALLWDTSLQPLNKICTSNMPMIGTVTLTGSHVAASLDNLRISYVYTPWRQRVLNLHAFFCWAAFCTHCAYIYATHLSFRWSCKEYMYIVNQLGPTLQTLLNLWTNVAYTIAHTSLNVLLICVWHFLS